MDKQHIQSLIQDAMAKEKQIRGCEHQIYPVFRSRSHPHTNKDGYDFIRRDHTAESTIFYSLDLGKTYMLIDKSMTAEAGLSEEAIHQYAINNLKRLDTNYKEDQVAGNQFYFFGQQDGYAASRLLNDELVSFMRRKVKGEYGVAIPHQDILIIADIQNEAGYKVLSKIAIDFCMKGDIPVSPLPFLFTDDGSLDPILIVSNPGASPTIRREPPRT